MMDFLKNHPFEIEAFFESSIVLSFAVPKDLLVDLIPACLDLDTFQDKWGFVAVAMVQTKNLRPKGFPKFLGNDFFLIGYRVFVRYESRSGKRLRGLYILKSETDKLKMQFLGNVFTHYKYSTTDINVTHEGGLMNIISVRSGIELTIDTKRIQPALPEGSPFSDWKEARRFAGPLPFTFSFDEKRKEVLIIEGMRENWQPQPISVQGVRVGFFEELRLKNSVLANAFEVKNIPYIWKKGRIEQWPQTETDFKV